VKLKVKNIILFVLILIVIVVSLIIFVGSLKEEKNKETKEPINNIVEEKPIEKKISLVAVGDVLIHESVYLDALMEDGTYDFSHMFKEIEPILQNYDLKFCNQESTIGGNYLGISGYPNFNSPDEIGDEIVNIGFNMISLANNHVMDKGEDAVLYSNSYWKSKNVITAGSYSNMEEMTKEKIYETNNIKYAFLSYTTVLNKKTSKEYLVNQYSDEKVKQDIEKIKDKVDLIIVSMHWGDENENYPNYEQKRIAQYLSSLGVDLIIGHHPHVVQPITYINDTLVIYSLGNFISNQLYLDKLEGKINRSVGLIAGVDILLTDEGVKFENMYKELIFSYSDNSTNFKVIPFSKLNDNLLNNYKQIEEEYMEILMSEVIYD